MTFGIDVSKNQAGINYATAKSEGVSFVIVKAAGFNTGSLYVADHYHEHIDAVINARIAGKGHYYIVGKGDVLAQAKYFVDHLYKFDKDHDVLAIDNEPLDSNATHWKQDDLLKFCNYIVTHTGIAWNRVWAYSPAALTRDNGPWDKITNQGIRIWWSSYGSFPTGHTPDHEPALNGKIARWDVHQYTDRATVAGHSVDAEFSHLTVYQLFNLVAPKPSGTTPIPVVNRRYTQAVPNKSGDGWAFNKPAPALTARIQRALGRRNRYSGPANGVFNKDTAIGVQKTIQNVGYTGPLDGDIGKIGSGLIQDYAAANGGYAGPKDNALGTYSWTGFALGLERP